MRISREDLKKPEFRTLRNNLRLFHGTKPTAIGTLLSIIAAIGELGFTIAMVVVLIVDTKYTFTEMLVGLVVSLILHGIANAYDKRFSELRF